MNTRRILALSFTLVTLALLSRALIVEPFQITTGSMAPTLLGVHRQCTCPKCGYLVVVGAPSDDSPSNHFDVRCPKCGQDNLDLDQQPDRRGQRIYVDKVAFEWRMPRRWEVVVFRGPDENASPMVKRIVGLPGESVQIKDGEVFINGTKTLKPAFLQRETIVPAHQARSGVTTDYWTYNGAKVNQIENVGNDKKEGRPVHYQSVGRHGIEVAYRLGHDEYFMLGDNSPISDDSRFWPSPGVKWSALIGPVIYPRLGSGE